MSLMNLVLPFAFLLAAGGDPAPQIAVPSAANSTVPTLISLVGTEGGVPDRTRGEFSVIVRKFNNNPWPNASVVVDLSGCLDLAICEDQHEAFPATIVNCPAKTVKKFSGADGSVTFTVCGGGHGMEPYSLIGAGRIFAEGTLIGSPTVAAYDLDGVAGLGANDLSILLRAFGAGVDFGACDFDGNGRIGANDFSLWLVAYGEGHQIESCAVACP